MHLILRLFLVCTTMSIHKSPNPMATERQLITCTGINGVRSMSIYILYYKPYLSTQIIMSAPAISSAFNAVFGNC